MSSFVYDNRKLVWEQDFNNISSLEETAFTYKRTMQNIEIDLVRDDSNIKFNNSCMILKANRTEDDSELFYRTPDGLVTENTMSFRMGYLEMKAKVPFEHGAWPSFWLCTTSELSDTGINAEVDIFEVFSSSDTAICNLHKWHKQNGELLHAQYPSVLKKRFTFGSNEKPDDWHIWGFEWTNDKYRFFVDGNCYCTFDITENGEFSDIISGMSCFSEYHHILINNFLFTPKSPDWIKQEYRLDYDENKEIKYEIDYIRLYQNSDKEDCIINGKHIK